jgi:hypothetical protein
VNARLWFQIRFPRLRRRRPLLELAPGEQQREPLEQAFRAEPAAEHELWAFAEGLRPAHQRAIVLAYLVELRGGTDPDRAVMGALRRVMPREVEILELVARSMPLPPGLDPSRLSASARRGARQPSGQTRSARDGHRSPGPSEAP